MLPLAITLLSPLFAHAAPPDRPVTLYGGLGFHGSPMAPGGGVQGSLAWHAHARFGLIASLGEAVVASPHRTIGTITLAARLPMTPWLSGELGFAHAHETDWHDFVDAPFKTLAGTHDSMIHRSGLMAGLRAEHRYPQLDRLGVFARVGADLYPDRHPTPVQLSITFGFALDVGPDRRRDDALP